MEQLFVIIREVVKLRMLTTVNCLADGYWHTIFKQLIITNGQQTSSDRFVGTFIENAFIKPSILIIKRE